MSVRRFQCPPCFLILISLLFVSFAGSTAYAQSNSQSSFEPVQYYQSIPFFHDDVLAKSYDQVQQMRSYYAIHYRNRLDVAKIEYWYNPDYNPAVTNEPGTLDSNNADPNAEQPATHELTYVTYYDPHRIPVESRNYQNKKASGVWVINKPIHFANLWTPDPTMDIRPVVYVEQFFMYIHRPTTAEDFAPPPGAEPTIMKELKLNALYTFDEGFLRRIQFFVLDALGNRTKELNILIPPGFPREPITTDIESQTMSSDELHAQLLEEWQIQTADNADTPEPSVEEAIYDLDETQTIASGYYREYNPDGSLIREVQFEGGKAHIAERNFDRETGRIQTVHGFHRGEAWGNQVQFHEDSFWMYDIRRADGEYHKRIETQSDSIRGQEPVPRISREITRAQERGQVWEWDEHRRLVFTRNYRLNDEGTYAPYSRQTTYKYYGTTRRTLLVDDYDTEGELRSRNVNYYLPNGLRIKEENYGANLLPNGIWRYYNETGTLNRIEEYRDGIPHGYWYFFETYEGEPRITNYELYEMGRIIDQKETMR